MDKERKYGNEGRSNSKFPDRISPCIGHQPGDECDEDNQQAQPDIRERRLVMAAYIIGPKIVIFHASRIKFHFSHPRHA